MSSALATPSMSAKKASLTIGISNLFTMKPARTHQGIYVLGAVVRVRLQGTGVHEDIPPGSRHRR
jgi:hypothetical protein